MMVRRPQFVSALSTHPEKTSVPPRTPKLSTPLLELLWCRRRPVSLALIDGLPGRQGMPEAHPTFPFLF